MLCSGCLSLQFYRPSVALERRPSGSPILIWPKKTSPKGHPSTQRTWSRLSLLQCAIPSAENKELFALLCLFIHLQVWKVKQADTGHPGNVQEHGPFGAHSQLVATIQRWLSQVTGWHQEVLIGECMQRRKCSLSSTLSFGRQDCPAPQTKCTQSREQLSWPNWFEVPPLHPDVLPGTHGMVLK